MKTMSIDDNSVYKESLYCLLNNFTDFEDAVQDGEPREEVINFIREDLCNVYDTFNSLREDIDKISVPKKPFSRKQELFRDKTIAFLYSNLISFCITDKVKGIPILNNFISNMSAVLNDTKCIHHLHITGDIYSYAHTFCNEKVRENYFKISVIAHNLFRFDFFFLVKGLRASIWKTKDIVIGGKNPTHINFAYISNQIQFIDTIKYFQQSLGGLANSLTSSEEASIYDECQKYLIKNDKLSKKFISLNETDQEWVLNYLSSRKGTIPYELISDFDSLSISPDKDFFEIH